ncbi:MAG: alpha-(1-_3)-arabinofuranosyltransferase domain-containing protein [Ilumatobacteraceae bacterium]
MSAMWDRITRAVRARPDRAVTLFFAFAAYVPMLLTRPGEVSADTKSYLTLDPDRLLASAASMWDPSVGAGTVPHQNIGYLFPLGPYYWLMERLAVPDWLTQRLLWATIVFAAAVGTYRLARWLGWRAGAALVAGFAYAFSPYLLSYLARLSVILAPWAAMPWMILLAAKAARTRSWRPAAWFAVVVLLVGSVNATSLVFVGMAPVLWLVADVVSGRVAALRAGAAALRIGVLTLGVSAWWIAALSVQGAYGLPILRYTETYQAVAGASTPNEILRGLGYWFFYGGDGLDPWVGPSTTYTNHAVLMTLGFTLAGLALLGLLVEFSGRAFTALLLAVGLAVSVGAAPLGDSTIYGAIFERFATSSTVGQALRSTPRAAPLVLLALAFGLGAGSEWLRARLSSAERRRIADLVPALAVVLVALQLFPWFTGRALTPSLLRDEALPLYEEELASWLDSTETGRVYELPGADFAHYRWGGTIDPVLPGIIDRPYLARELVPQGGDGTADLLNGFERRLWDGWFEPESLVPVAQLLDVATVVTRNDLEHERFRLARPGPLWTDITSVLGSPDHAGPLTTDRTVIPLVDELTLARPDAAEDFPAVAAFDIGDAPAISALPASAPVIVAGSGDALVDLAGAGLLDTSRPVLYAATLESQAADGELDQAALGTGAWWIVTDTNRKQGRRWSTLGSNLGALETDGPLVFDDDPGDNRLEVFEDRLADQTVAAHRPAVADVRAGSYGNRVAYIGEDAPHLAVDGDPATAWRAGVFDETEGLVWQLDLTDATRADELTLLQPLTGAVGRYMTDVRLTFDGERSLDVALDERSRAIPGQTIELTGEPFTTLRIEVLADNVGPLASYVGQPGVGLAEVAIPGITDDRPARLPDLADTTFLPEGVPTDQRLTLVMTRQRIDPATPNRAAPEATLTRRFVTANDRPFDLVGEVRVAASADDATIAAALGDPEAAIADRRLPGAPGARGAAARDGRVDTAWQTPFGDARGATLTIEHGASGLTTGEVTISWLDDGQHSVPTALSITNETGDRRDLALPAVDPVDGVATASLPIPAYDARTSTVVVTDVEDASVPDYFSGLPQVLPIGVAEIAFAGEVVPSIPGEVDSGCRADLFELDGAPIPVRVTGDRETALARGELRLTLCESPLGLAAGSHTLHATAGAATGFDVDRVVLDSTVPAVAAGPPPAVEVLDEGRTSLHAEIGPSPEVVWLTLNQSWNAGWAASVDGEDLGPPILIDGYANGWLLSPSGETRVVELDWAPQGRVRMGMALSLAAVLAVLAILAWPRRPRSPERHSDEGDPVGPLVDRSGVVLAVALVVGFAVAGGAAAAIGAVLAVAAAERWPRLPPIVVLVAGFFASAPIVVLEYVRDYSDGPDWPSRFAWTTPFAWVAVAAVVATMVFRGPLRVRPDAWGDDSAG